MNIRLHAADLRRLAFEHGVSALRFASAGRLLGHLDDDRDVFDAIGFEVAATDLLGAHVEFSSDAVLTKANVSSDLVAASQL